MWYAVTMMYRTKKVILNRHPLTNEWVPDVSIDDLVQFLLDEIVQQHGEVVSVSSAAERGHIHEVLVVWKVPDGPDPSTLTALPSADDLQTTLTRPRDTRQLGPADRKG